ncbi:phosphoglucosamine mutase [Candidatus Methylacidiphilum infernorum]|uniref:Phosphoglucosamine mutase n=1 Tax=Candidatus Methylacidiphilum infernorum TaxID=511746 RepID=A0ABX7PXI5_9BACT|nr:phosphoglucosamine mutase [Candidatus Methylacidiphilum infernorum]QSR87378.1 phosphoglucosamine mutase [Candidatus Methylacidiphilum infernorum]
MNPKAQSLFGTDGIRGKANVYPMTPQIALAAGAAAAKVFTAHCPSKKKQRMVVGRDTRISSRMLEYAVISGVISQGVDVFELGVVPSPAVANFSRVYEAIGGVMVSASHNPFYDNGLKFFDHDGGKLGVDLEKEIEKEISSFDWLGSEGPTGSQVGKIFLPDNTSREYQNLLKSFFPGGLDLKGIKIALDTANGASFEVAPAILDDYGAFLYAFGKEPNGININLNCGSLFPQNIQQFVRLSGADIGIALDGDGDRVVLCDENGELCDGDDIISILASDFKDKNRLSKNKIAVTVMSNLGLDETLEAEGIGVIRTPVGDRNVAEVLAREGLSLGGEQSGHIIPFDYSKTADGLLAALIVLQIMCSTGKSLGSLRKKLIRYPQKLWNIDVSRKKPLEEIPGLKKLLDESQALLDKKGRVLLRYSGTEPKIRLLVEAKEEERVQQVGQKLFSFLKEALS